MSRLRGAGPRGASDFILSATYSPITPFKKQTNRNKNKTHIKENEPKKKKRRKIF